MRFESFSLSFKLFQITTFLNFILILTGVPAVAAESGSVKGSVQFFGPLPDARSYEIKVNPEICGNRVAYQFVSVSSENHGVRDAFVTIRSKDGSSLDGDRETVSLDNLKCRIEPQVIGMGKDQTLLIRNSDPVFHSLQFFSQDHLLFNTALPAGAEPLKRKVEQAGEIQVRCSVHPFMQGTLYVSDTPNFHLTDRFGGFQFSNLKPGAYILKALHRGLKPVEKEFEINSGENLNLTILMERAD
jgi:hypothetical protein